VTGPSDFVEGSVWYSPSYSGYVWLVLTSRSVSRRTGPRFGECLILDQNELRDFSFPIGSVVQWDSMLQWCKSSVRIV